MSNFSAESEESSTMAFVISLTDGTGREFYISAAGEAIPLDTPSDVEPLVVKTWPQVDKQLEKLKPLYPPTCTLYGILQKEFEARRQAKQNSPEKS